MQGNDIQVLRLDYTREPPGYMVGAGGDFQSEGDSELWPRTLAWSDSELAQVIGYVRGDKLALSELQRLGVVRG